MAVAAALLAGCSVDQSQSALPLSAASQRSSTGLGIARDAKRRREREATAGYVYVSNRTAQGASELQVYLAGVQNPSPIKTLTSGLREVGGIDVDPSGNVYVANGSAGNVLEFSPGGASLVQTYSESLVHPTDVTIANGTLYVADQGNAANGYLQQTIEFPIGSSTPSEGIAGVGNYPVLNEGVAVDPQASPGPFWGSASSLTAVPPDGGCSGSTDLIAINVLPTLWADVPLSNNQQAWGLAFSSSGTLYASDFCNNDVPIYAGSGVTWTYMGKVSGTFLDPLFLTINDGFLAIPSASSLLSAAPGYATIIDLQSILPTVTITNGLEHPVGAAVGTI
jgi:hypothetical protein